VTEGGASGVLGVEGLALSPVSTALLLSLLFTSLICLIEIPSRSKASLRACLGGSFVVYVLIFIVGNATATLLAPPLAPTDLSAALAGWAPLFYAFSGVFAFQGILGNTNVTFFGQGVLTIEEWVAKARDNAVANAVKKQARLELHYAQQCAEDLREKLSPAELNTYVARYMNPETVKKLEADAANANADPGLYKALWFAMEKPEEAAAVARRRKKLPAS